MTDRRSDRAVATTEQFRADELRPRHAAREGRGHVNRRAGRGRDPLADGTPHCVSGTAARVPDLNPERQLPLLSGQAPPRTGPTSLRPTNRTLLLNAARRSSCAQARGFRKSGTAAKPAAAYSSTARRVRMLSSAASTMRRLLTASSIHSDRSRSSRMAFRKNACSRSHSSW
jgi:hypothetical protein